MDPPRATRIKAKARAAGEQLEYERALRLFDDLSVEFGLAAQLGGFLPRHEARSLWSAYLLRLHREARCARRWAETDRRLVRAELAAALAGSSTRCFWVLPEPRPVAAAVDPTALDADTALSFSSRQRDLMLASAGAGDGLCLELNAIGRLNEYELVTWGTFAVS